ncbi:MAG: type IV secretion system DNA-binding domain-containing protein, partial [Chloroflexota bacterium]|nr:type IV secretion system DNA-binding domain-containing protein [Chloroflexota bacterium]
GAALPLPYRGRVAEPAIRLGVNRVREREVPVRLSVESRNQHLWVLGKTGVGKSTLIANMALQDIHAGRGVIVIDPHGDLIRDIAGRVPKERVEDVILFDPADSDYPVGINLLECESDEERALIVSSFIDIIEQIYDPHNQGIAGPRFQHGARNVMLTVMYSPGGTLVEVVRAFQDDAYVRSILPYVTDPMVKRYWHDQISKTSDYHRSEVLDWLVSKFSHFTVDMTMRRILGQSKSAFRFRQAMDTSKIVLISLGKGKLGSANANFIGFNLLPMILHAALSRANVAESERRPVTLSIDEFQNYASNALASMLSEARKYKLSLMLANQHIGQLSTDVREAVMGNAGSIISFRTGAADARTVEAALEPSPVAASHLMDLPRFTAYARLLSDGQQTPVFTLETEPLAEPFSQERYEEVREWSRAIYGRPKAEVDAEMERRANFGGSMGRF